MRTGRAPIGLTNAQQEVIEQVIGVLATMMEQALRDAAAYVQEAKRTVVMPRDVELALKRLVLPGSDYWKREDLCQTARTYRQEMFSNNSESASSEDEWIVDLASDWTEASGSQFAESMNSAPARFDAWQPEIPFMQALKRGIVSATQ